MERLFGGATTTVVATKTKDQKGIEKTRSQLAPKGANSKPPSKKTIMVTVGFTGSLTRSGWLGLARVYAHKVSMLAAAKMV